MSIGRVPGATGIQPSIVDAKGDLIVATAADSVDRLAVGSNNQTLLADSAQTTGVKWASSPQSLMTATGDLLYASSANTPARLAIGSTSQVLTVSGGVPAWATPSSGGMTSIASGSLSGSSVDITSISNSYNELMLFINNASQTSTTNLRIRVNGSTGNGQSGYDWMQLNYNTSSTPTNTGASGETSVKLTGTNMVNTGTRNSFVVYFPKYAVSTKKIIYGYAAVDITSGNRMLIHTTGVWDFDTVVDEVNILTGDAGGTFDNGTYTLYGVK